MSIEQSDVIWGVAGTGVFGFLARFGMTMLNRQGLIQAGDNSQKDLIQNLGSEADKWKNLHEHERIEHEQTKKMLTMLQIQNAMLKILLKQSGVSTEEIEAIETEFAPKSVIEQKEAKE